MPFTNDPAKQARYIAYLHSQSTPDHPELLPPKLPGQTSEAYHKELSDYSKSAGIFKPVSGAMAGRFTTAAVVELGPNAVEGLHQPTHEVEPTPPQQQEEKEREKEKEMEARRREEEVQGSKAHAARTGMYGALTREIVPWQPARLLCKRFGVKDPNPDITTDTPMPGVSHGQAQGTGDNAWKAEEALAEADLQTATGSVDVNVSSSTEGRRAARDLENVGLGEDDSQGRDTLTYVRPSMDIFKAIFASDDEDSDDEPEGEGQETGVPDAGPSTLPTKGPEKQQPTENSDGGAIPVHLRIQDAAEPTSTYEPRSAQRPPETVDVATFKPVFVPRGERESQKLKDKKDGGSSRGKDKKKAKAIVSFEDDDEGAALTILPQTDKDKDGTRKKKKRRKEKGNGEGGEDVDMWVEKPPPQVVTNLVDATVPAEGKVQLEGPAPPPAATEGPPRSRKRAIDFL
jgi:G patch domain-containing protein 1